MENKFWKNIFIFPKKFPFQNIKIFEVHLFSSVMEVKQLGSSRSVSSRWQLVFRYWVRDLSNIGSLFRIFGEYLATN